MTTKHLAALIPEEKLLKFGIIAAKIGISKSELIRRLIDAAIIKDEAVRGCNLRKGGRI